MIRLVYFAGTRRLYSIEDVPTAALSIVREFDSDFEKEPTETTPDCDWTDASALSLDKAEQLRVKLNEAGFECEFSQYG